jgi:hypothetical protein
MRFCPRCRSFAAGVCLCVGILTSSPSHDLHSHERARGTQPIIRAIVINSSTATVSGPANAVIWSTPGYEPGKT